MKNNTQTPPEGPRLIFHWPRTARMQASLPIFFLFAVIIHALSFYLFQISYPPAVSMRPPPASLRILLPHTPETQTLLARIDLEDPALAVRGSDRNLNAQNAALEVSYAASFENRSITPLIPPAAARTDSLPPALYPKPVRSVSPQLGRKLPDTQQAKSRIRFQGSLAGGNPEIPLLSKPVQAAANARVPDYSEYLVQVSASGEVRSVFLQKSSGSREADERGDLWLRKCRFTEPQYAGLWGSALIHWGADAYPTVP